MVRENLETINRQGTADAQKAATFEGDYAKIMAELQAKTMWWPRSAAPATK